MATRRRLAAMNQEDGLDFAQIQSELTELRAMKSQLLGIEKVLEWQAKYGERIDNLGKSLEELKEAAKVTKEDHDKRLTELERWKSESRGERNVLVVMAGIVGAVITWIMEHAVK